METSFNLYGPLNDLGYGIFTRGLIKGLIELGKSDFHLSMIGPPQLENQSDLGSYTKQLQEVPWSRKAPSIAIWHEFDLNKFSGNKLVAFPIFETNSFFPAAKNYLSQMDAIFVPSKWAKSVVENNIGLSVPTFSIPAGSNLIETPEVLNTTKFPSFTFVHVGKYEKRKSTLELIQAYMVAFETKQVDTRLICHCHNPFDSNFAKNMRNILTQLGLTVLKSSSPTSIVAIRGNCIVEIPIARLQSHQVFQLYRSAHIGIFPAKAEGWNLPLMEAIKSGLPCIATNYSAPTEYLTEEFDYNQELLLKDLTMETAIDGVFFHGNRGEWCTFKTDALANKLLYAYNNYTEVLSKFSNVKIKETFTWKNMAAKFTESLSMV